VNRTALFFSRLAASVSRPAALLLEGLLLRDQPLLVYIVPVAALAVTVSSLPTYASYYKILLTKNDPSKLAAEYAVSVLIMLIVSVVCGSLFLLLSSTLPLAVFACAFIVDKLCDEVCRLHEFCGQHKRWLFFQFARSGFPLIPIILCGYWGLSGYIEIYLLVAFMAAILFAIEFLKQVAFPRGFLAGINLIVDSIHYMPSVFIVGATRQGPKIILAALLPTISYFYQVVSQLMVPLTVFLNSRYQIPFRKIISAKVFLFEKVLRKLMSSILVGVLVTSFFSSIFFIHLQQGYEKYYLFIIIFVGIISETIGNFSLSAYLGYLRWLPNNTYVILKLSVVLAFCLLCMLGFTFLARGGQYIYLLPQVNAIAIVVMVISLRKIFGFDRFGA
jgi:hypothetical protein